MFRHPLRSLTAAALLAASLPASLAATPPPAGITNQEYQVITVEAGNVGATTTLGGSVVPLKEVAFSAQLPGRVEFVAGREGDWFKEGTVLVAISEDDLQAKRQAALAALANARSAMSNARVQYTRQVYAGSEFAHSAGMGIPTMLDQYFTRPMSGATGTSDPELLRRAEIYAHGTRIDQAQAGIAQAQAQVRELDAMLRNTKSIAPFDGVIVRKQIEVGDTVQPGMPMVAYADTRHLQVKVDVPARLMPGLRKGMVIPAKLDVGNTRVETKVAQIYPMADAQRHTVTVKLDLPTDAPGGPGMYAEVMIPDITTPIERLPTIPTSSVVWRGSLPAVFAVTKDAKTELRMVRLGGFVDNNRVSVLSGIQAGDRILASPPPGMAAGWKSGTAQPSNNK